MSLQLTDYDHSSS